ncbi:hypothetical protein [Streptomyces sp. NPDC048496]|uniref:hypothetical protein n=1 Tax=Streptomyces sp. NPDC048496 TaxID=3365558 RepID=UPI0037124E60
MTDYVTPDTDNWLISYPSEVVTADNSICMTRPGEVTGRARTYYDGVDAPMDVKQRLRHVRGWLRGSEWR